MRRQPQLNPGAMLALAAMAFAFVPRPAAPQTADPVDPSPDAAAQTAAAVSPDLDEFITQSMIRGCHPGLAALILKEGRVVWSANYGLAEIDPAVPVADDTLFMLASISKTVTSVSLLQLWEQGRFQLDDDINGFLPFPVRNPHFPDVPITFRMLLTHHSSIQDNPGMIWGSHLYCDGDSPVSLRNFVEGLFVPGRYYVASTFSHDPPGTVFRYSNFGFALVGYLVESISGVPFEVYTRQHIFEPLGMLSTGWYLRDLGSAPIAMPYRCNYNSSDGKSAVVWHAYGQYGFPDIPDGALRTSAQQLALFLGAIINGGELDGVRILQAPTVQAMLTPAFPLSPGCPHDGSPCAEGLGWTTYLYDGDTYWGHFGGDRGIAAAMFFRPSDGTGVIVLANGDPWGPGLPEVVSVEDRLFEEAQRF